MLQNLTETPGAARGAPCVREGRARCRELCAVEEGAGERHAPQLLLRHAGPGSVAPRGREGRGFARTFFLLAKGAAQSGIHRLPLDAIDVTSISHLLPRFRFELLRDADTQLSRENSAVCSVM